MPLVKYAEITAPVTVSRALSFDRKDVWAWLMMYGPTHFTSLPPALSYEAQVMIRERVIFGDKERCWLIWTPANAHKKYH